MLVCADVCWRVLACAGVCWRVLTCADVCWLARTPRVILQQARWQSAFNASDAFFSGAAPILDLDGADETGSTAWGVARVYYASILSVVSQVLGALPHVLTRAGVCWRVLTRAGVC